MEEGSFSEKDKWSMKLHPMLGFGFEGKEVLFSVP